MHLADLAGFSGREADNVARFLDHIVRNAAFLAEPRLFEQMPGLAMDGHEDFRLQPGIERLELRAPGMAGYVDEVLLVGDHHDPAFGQTVLDRPDGDFVAGDLAA